MQINYDDIVNSNLSNADKLKALAERKAQIDSELNKQKIKDIMRAGAGAVLQGASMHPIFNIPYVGTGLGGAMFEAGQGLMEGSNLKDVGKKAAQGFAIGETIGAIPYVGKAVGKTKAGKAVTKTASNVAKNFNNTNVGKQFQKAAAKVEDVLMSEFAPIKNFNKQTTYHGSPYDFGKFSNEAIGTGEGFQAHGMGHYVAKNKDVADKNYRDRLAQDYYLNGKKISETSKEYDMIDTFNDYKTSKNPTLEDAKAAYIAQQKKYLDRYNTPETERIRKITQDYIDLANSIDLNNLEVKSGGQLYKLSVPKDNVLLREGESFENQPEIVQKGLNNIKKDYLKSKGYNSIDEINAELDTLSNQYKNIVKNENPYDFYAGNEKSEIQTKISKLENLRRFNETPDLYNYLLNHQHLEPYEVSDLLYKQGIKGISYNGGIDGEARVIFNPDDINIVRKYYNQPTLAKKLTGNINFGAVPNSLAEALRNPKYPMTDKEFKEYENLGLNFYRDYLQPNPVTIDNYGTVYFNRKNRGKDDITNFKVYPDLREQLMGAERGKNTNYKNELDRNYDYFYNTWNDIPYEYLIENITDVGKRYKKMKNLKTGK